jgi:hypothetical protein
MQVLQDLLESLPLFLFCLLPVAFYFLFLSWINALRRCSLISGSWDFVGVLAAASGFILMGGSLIPAGLTEWIKDMLPAVNKILLWDVLALTYLVLVLGGAARTLWHRRNQTSIYNVDPPVLEETLGEILDGLNLHWRRVGHALLIRPAGVTKPAKEEDARVLHGENGADLPPPEPPLSGPALLETEVRLDLDPAPGMRHVTLKWDENSDPLRQLVEAKLHKRGEQLYARDNPLSFRFLCSAGLLTLVSLLGLAVMAIALWRQNH